MKSRNLRAWELESLWSWEPCNLGALEPGRTESFSWIKLLHFKVMFRYCQFCNVRGWTVKRATFFKHLVCWVLSIDIILMKLCLDLYVKRGGRRKSWKCCHCGMMLFWSGLSVQKQKNPETFSTFFLSLPPPFYNIFCSYGAIFVHLLAIKNSPKRSSILSYNLFHLQSGIYSVARLLTC